MRMTEGLLRETLIFGGAFKELSKEEINKKVSFLYNFIGECFVEKEVELSTPAPHFLDANQTVKEIVNEVQTKSKQEVLLIVKGVLFNLFDMAEFADWDELGDFIGGAIENHPRMKSYKDWEEYEEERKELKELCISYNVNPETLDNDQIKQALAPKIIAAYDAGGEIGLLEKEIIDALPNRKKVSKPNPEFIKQQFKDEALN